MGDTPLFPSCGPLLTSSPSPSIVWGEQFPPRADVRVRWATGCKALAQNGHYVRRLLPLWEHRCTPASDSASQKCLVGEWYEPWILYLVSGKGAEILRHVGTQNSSPANPLRKNYQTVCTINHKTEPGEMNGWQRLQGGRNGEWRLVAQGLFLGWWNVLELEGCTTLWVPWKSLNCTLKNG